MAKRKEPLEKLVWVWAEKYDIVTDDNIRTAYKLKMKQHKPNTCKRSCRGNANCLSGWGESQWTDEINKDEVLEEGLQKRRRVEGSHVGLKNLGNTCYMNSLLQLWFHNVHLREAVYGWNAAEDPRERLAERDPDKPFEPVTSVGHLQLLFAEMQFGQSTICDPERFCTSLSIDVELQQDAQEFNKLYLNQLEEAFSNQTNEQTKYVIENHLRGQYRYVTKCDTCQAETKRDSFFYELELNVKDCQTILDSLQGYLKEEALTGDNQYFCQQCYGFRNATMQTRLVRLPKILQLQLLRYAFDSEKGTKRKLHCNIQFPDQLDLTPFMAEGAGLEVEEAATATTHSVYSLHALLMHGGGTAYSGHYYAHIKTTEGWHVFNDATVKKQKALNLSQDEVSGRPDKKAGSSTKLKGFRSSTAAYMLVYTKEDDEG